MPLRPWLLSSLLGFANAEDPGTYREPLVQEYWAPSAGTSPPFEAPRYTDLTPERFNDLIVQGKVFIVPNLSHDWPMKDWDCDFFATDPEFRKAAMTHQYTAGGGSEVRIGDSWQGDQTASGAKNESAPQIAPFYWGIKDVQYEKRPGWKKSMLKRVVQNCRVPSFMPSEETKDSFYRTPEFWFGSGKAGAKAHMDSHIQATLSLQLAGTKRWLLMPLQERRAPFSSMIYGDGQPYENAEGWHPLFDILLRPGDGLFFPPGMVHETLNVGEVCAASVTFQFDTPYAGAFYRRFFPRVRRTADIHESWILIRSWARLEMPGDAEGRGARYKDARGGPVLVSHFRKVDKDKDGFLALSELRGLFSSGMALGAMGWHDQNADGFISLDEFADGFAFWSGITHDVIQETPKQWRKFQLHGTIENLEDLPSKLARDALAHSLKAEAKLALPAAKTEL